MRSVAPCCAAVAGPGSSRSAHAAAAEPGEEIISAVMSLGIPAPTMAPPKGRECTGPYRRLVLENANIIDGAGAPIQGPVTIVIENDRIIDLRGRGTGSLHLEAEQFSGDDTRVIDASGKYVLPGLIDAHAHLGTPTHGLTGALTEPDYVLKLWLAHGITTIREPGALMGLEWTLAHRRRSDCGEISAPRMKVHALFPELLSSPSLARDWVGSVHAKGADGVKFLGAPPKAMAAAIDEARRLGIKTMCHHSQVAVAQMNVLDTARLGLHSMEHWYGLPEAMFTDRRVQNYPAHYNYNNEQDRFSLAGGVWEQAASRGSATWGDTIRELIGLDFTLTPTFTVYEANRDLMRARRAEWLDEFAMPYVMRAFEPNPRIHGSFHYDWSTADEIAWKRNYQHWMAFINDYKNAGGRIAAGSDSGFIYNLYGFGYIRELELLQEAGFHPLEVVQAATLNGAQLLGIDDDTGSIQIGKKADLVVVDENPLANFKVLFGVGHPQLDRETGKVERTTGILYTIKDGLVFDARALLASVKHMVAARKLMEADKATK